MLQLQWSLGQGVAAEISSDRVSPDNVSRGHYIAGTRYRGEKNCEEKISSGQSIAVTFIFFVKY
jgi:hypothetical protein